MRIRGERYALVGLLCIAVCTDVMAQDAITFLSEANTQIRSAGSLIYQVVIAVLSVIPTVTSDTIAITLSTAITT